jgi:LmbE family N-acetylglucosaminyl deacetylase
VSNVFKWAFLAPAAFAAGEPGRILVVTGSSGDYILGAGATLARYVREGWRVDVVQVGNDEKWSGGLTAAQTRLANVAEGKAAAKLLGITGVVMMDHKSGELGHVSSTEIRAHLFALIRGMKPRIIFLPDPYVHYQDDHDAIFVGKAAEEAWGYSGGAMFAGEAARMGFPPYGAPEVFYYSAYRPYRRGEGGVGKAKFVARDIGETFEHKAGAVELLQTRNRAWAAMRVGLLDDFGVRRFARAFVTALAEAVGAKHGFRLGEEFNHVGP